MGSEEYGVKVMDKLTEIGERLAVVETLLKERSTDTDTIYKTLKSFGSRIGELEKHRNQVIGAKDVFTWLAMAAIAVWGVISK